MKLHPVELERLTPEILHVFGRQPPLLTAGDKTGLNTMTIGWCQLGRLWNLPVCTVYVRPERYTYQFMESHDYFTVSILPEEAKKSDRPLRQQERPGRGQGESVRPDGPLGGRGRALL